MRLVNNSTYLLWVSVFLIFLGLGIYNIIKSEKQTLNKEDLNLLSSIEQNAVPLVQYESGDIDWSFLEEHLEGKEVLLLGGQGSGDGSSLKIMSDMVRYLHDTSEFNVVFFANSFFKVYSLNNRISSDSLDHRDFVEALGLFLGQSKETEKLREYKVSQDLSAHPLTFAGIDYRIPIRFQQKEISTNLKSYFRSYPDFITGNYSSFWKSLENTAGPILYFNAPQKEMDKERIKCLEEIRSLRDLIVQRKKPSRIDSVYLRYIENIYNVYLLNINRNVNVNHFNDSLMFENLMWQIENFFPDQKVIIWTANDQLVYGAAQPINKNIGSLIKGHFGNKAHSILFTSYQGRVRNSNTHRVNVVNQALQSTIEYGMHLKGHKLTYVPIDPISKNRESTSFQMRILGHNNLVRPWLRMMDSFIYIDNMEAVHYD